MFTSCNFLTGVLLALLFLHPLAARTRGATFGTNSFSDAFVTTGPSGNLSGNNYGSAGALGLSAAGLPKGEFQSALQFDLAGARSSFDGQYGAGQWSVLSVALQLTATPTNNAIFNATSAGQFQVFWMQNDSWTEGTGSPTTPTTTGITFTSLQNTFIGAGDESLGTFSFNGAASGAATYALSLTPGFTADLLAGNDVSLRMAAADGSVSYLFNSRNFGTAANRPLFTVTATTVPEPGVAALGSLGLAWFAASRISRRRKST